jgi:hypothetical protein
MRINKKLVAYELLIRFLPTPSLKLAQAVRVKELTLYLRLFNSELVDQIAAGRSSSDWLRAFKS